MPRVASDQLYNTARAATFPLPQAQMWKCKSVADEAAASCVMSAIAVEHCRPLTEANREQILGIMWRAMPATTGDDDTPMQARLIAGEMLPVLDPTVDRSENSG